MRAWATASKGLTADNAAEIQNALENFEQVTIPNKLRVDSMIEIPDQDALIIANGGELRRTADSASTDPVIWIKSSQATTRGMGKWSRITTANRCPRGIIRLGSPDMTTGVGSVSYCEVDGLRLEGSTQYGQTSGDPDQAIAFYVPQFSNNQVAYFNDIKNLHIYDVNTMIGLHGFANEIDINNINGHRVGNNAGLDYRCSIFINGAQECTIRRVFHHFSPDAYTIRQKILDNTANGGNIHTPSLNQVDIMGEQGGGTARLAYIEDSGLKNEYRLRSNVALAPIYPADFGLENELIVDGEYWTDIKRDGVSATMSKNDRTAGAAGRNFKLGNANPGASYRSGYIKVTASAENNGAALSEVAWFLYATSANGNPYPDGLTLIDSGGDVGTFTITLSNGNFQILTGKDNMTATVEYNNSAGNVGVA